MTRYAVTVEPHASLYVGGYAESTGASDGDTARGPEGLLIPGSTIKGALRESALRLVQATGRGREIFTDLFGEEASEHEGVLRVGALAARVDGAASDLPELTPRHHVSLERATRQAAPQRLFLNRVTPALTGLRFEGELRTTRELHNDEIGLLRSAVEITDQIGGGRGRGLGFVRVDLGEAEGDAGVKVPKLPDGDEVVLVLEACEPVQLGIVKDRTNVAASKDHLDGSTVRGAVAVALASDETRELILGGTDAVVFGDGRPGNSTAIPAPLTLREPKAGGLPVDGAAPLCAGRPLPHFDTRAAEGTFAQGLGGWLKVRVRRRSVTRTARDHASGRGADGALYTLEVIDPVIDVPEVAEDKRLRFHVPVTGTREQLAEVARAASSGLVVGGARSRGFGYLQLVEARRPGLPELAERHRRWIERVEKLGGANAGATGVVLALGPLVVDQARLVRSLERYGLELKDGVSRRQLHGGWNARKKLPRMLAGCFVPGSTFVVKTQDGSPALGALAELEEKGIGPGSADGWGRVVVCHPIHVDCSPDPKED